MGKSIGQKRATEKKSEKQTEASTNSPLVFVTRTFQAPVHRLWAAWSHPELIEQWWGPKEFSCPKAEADFKEGGDYLFAMKSPKGDVSWTTGEYRQIVPNQKIVCTDFFANEQGEIVSPREAGLSDWPDNFESVITVEFEIIDNEHTKMYLSHRGIPAKMHDDCVEGWSTSIDKMQELVEHH